MHRRILVADNDSTGLTLKKLAVEDTDLQIDDIQDAAAALRALNDQNYSVFLMDLNMPVKDGIEGLRSLKAEARTATIPVVIVSTRSEAPAIKQCLQLGCADFVSKPIGGWAVGDTHCDSGGERRP